jgi:uncharacterized protein YndB with AHSA1/START domain
MRFMIMVRANAVSESGAPPAEPLMAAMATFHQQLAQAGVLLDANGLKPSAAGWRVQYRSGTPTVVDGPFTESKELIAGYTLIQTRSREEAMEWARRFPAPFGAEMDGEIEVRPLYELDDFAPNAAVESFRNLNANPTASTTPTAPTTDRPEAIEASDPRDVLNQRHYPQPLTAVFAALTDPIRLARWWGPAGFTNRFAVCEPRPGGAWRHTMVGPDGTEYPNEARFVRVEAPHTWLIEHLNGHHFELLVTLAAAPEGGTVLRWRQRFDSAEHRDQIASFVHGANEQNLDRLAAELARPTA